MQPLTKLNLHEIDKLREKGYIKTNVHPSGDLVIYNYTEKCVYEKAWCPYTLQCRGLIADNEGNIVARPFPKFFNLGENGSTLPDEPFEVYEKLDGSLGISYFHKGSIFIATRGSFTSNQAEYATKMLRGSCTILNNNLTYLFEIIYPENRIVVNYGNECSLTLLAVIDTKTGLEHPYNDVEYGFFRDENFDSVKFPFRPLKKYDGIKDVESIRKLNEKNKEGFVLHFQSGLRVKVKFEDYVRLHSIVTQITKRKVWEMVKEGKSLYEFIEQIPDELFGWIKDTENTLNGEYRMIEADARKALNEIMQNYLHIERKSIALMILKCKHSHVMFRMLDKKDYSECIWKILEPEHEIPLI